MTIVAQFIEKIANLEQENKKLLEPNRYDKNYSDQLHQIIQDFKRHRFGNRSESYHHLDQQQFDFLPDIEPAKVAKTESIIIKKHTVNVLFEDAS